MKPAIDLPDSRSGDVLALVVVCFVVLVMLVYSTELVSFAIRSFDLDELSTVLITDQLANGATSGNVRYLGHGPFYCYLLSALVPATETPIEFSFRSLSFACMLLSLVGCGKIAWASWGRSAGILTVAILILNPDLLYYAFTTRPYALALLACVSSVLFLLEAIKSNRAGWWFASGFSVVVMFHAHYLFCLSLVFHSLLVSRLWGTISNRGKISLAVAVGLSLLATIVPMSTHLWLVAGGAQERAWGEIPGIGRLMTELHLVPPKNLLWILICAGAYCVVSDRQSVHALEKGASFPLFRPLLVWACFPVLLLFLLGWGFSLNVFIGRYFLHSLVPLSLLAAWALKRIENERSHRYLCASIIVGLYLIGQSGLAREQLSLQGREDWRGAVSFLNSTVGSDEGAIISISGHAESSFVRWLENDSLAEILSSPLRVYGYAKEIVNLPPRPLDTPLEAEYVNKLFVAHGRGRRVLVVARDWSFLEVWRPELDRRFAAMGLSAGERHSFGVTRVIEFHRTVSAR